MSHIAAWLALVGFVLATTLVILAITLPASEQGRYPWSRRRTVPPTSAAPYTMTNAGDKYHNHIFRQWEGPRVTFGGDGADGDIQIFGLADWGAPSSDRDDLIRVQFCMEPLDMRDRSYDVVVDCKREKNAAGRLVYFPYWVTVLHEQQSWLSVLRDTQRRLDRSRSKFCCFMYHRSYPHRNNLFDWISEGIGHVDAPGAARNNTASDNTRFGKFLDGCVARYSQYSYVIACESERLDGYTTEKLVMPLIAGAIPIYWGHPSVKETFSTDCFVDLTDLSYDDLLREATRDVVLERVRAFERRRSRMRTFPRVFRHPVNFNRFNERVSEAIHLSIQTRWR